MGADKITPLFSQPAAGLGKRLGTVQQINDYTLSVLLDGSTSPVAVARACSPALGDRVVILRQGTQWVAISVVGGGIHATGNLYIDNPYPNQRWGVVRADGKVDPLGTAPNATVGTDADGLAITRTAGETLTLLAGAPTSAQQISSPSGLALTLRKWGRLVQFQVGDTLAAPVANGGVLFSGIPAGMRPILKTQAANTIYSTAFPTGGIEWATGASEVRWYGTAATSGQRMLMSGIYISDQ